MIQRIRKRNGKGRSMLLVPIGLLVLLLGAAAPALGVPTISIEPGSTFVETDEFFDLQVMVNADVDTFSNFQIIIQFDPVIIELDTVFEGDLYVQAGFQNLFTVEEESLGTWEVFEVIFPFSSFLTAPGEVSRLRFHSLADGTTEIVFLSASVMDIDRVEILPLDRIDGFVQVGADVGVEESEGLAPQWLMSPPSPNPSRGDTRVRLVRPPSSPDGAFDLSVYDTRGRMVKRLTAQSRATVSDFVWDGRNGFGAEVPSGVYFMILKTERETFRNKVVLVR